MKLSLGFSPCPNDTFAFYQLVHAQDTVAFEPVIRDIEELNRLALAKALDITKVSVATYPLISDAYVMLDAGAALGFNCGPILVTKPGTDVSDLSRCAVAIPGMHTTANLLMTKAFPQVTDKPEMSFSVIEDAVMSNIVDAGVIIHESRFTYAKKGLLKVLDLGEWWHEKTQMPIPLGIIVARKNLGDARIAEVDRLLADSVRFALLNPEAPMDFVTAHAQAMEVSVMKQHIALYVNEFTVSLGSIGRRAIRELLSLGQN
jgi:1,4-dihydroxy-6-naphthoate synthase